MMPKKIYLSITYLETLELDEKTIEKYEAIGKTVEDAAEDLVNNYIENNSIHSSETYNDLEWDFYNDLEWDF